MKRLTMGDQCGTPNQKKTKTKKKKSEFEFCKACNINHDQGLRHKYFPNHKKSLSTFLSRFRNKLSHVRSILKSTNPLSPNLSPSNRFWCVFCDQDIHENSTSFPCDSAIRHLASADHVKNLKHFFWKYGGPADQLEAFMVSDDQVAKWEKRCVAQKDGASEGSRRTVVGPSSSDDIHNELNSGKIDSFEKIVYSNSVKSYPSNVVLPLQCYTGEYKYQVSCSGLSGFTNVATEVCAAANSYALQDFEAEKRNHSLSHDGRQWSSDSYSYNKQVHGNGGMVSGESSHQGVQKITWISPTTKSAGRNVYDGEPPPWLEATEAVQMHSNPVGKSKKWNPKRVGAAWAEKRKIEREKEKRGEIVRNECDANWLPNFGRVWQSGTRRESRKEFEREKQNLNVETQSEMPTKIQPYVGKRMVADEEDPPSQSSKDKKSNGPDSAFDSAANGPVSRSGSSRSGSNGHSRHYSDPAQNGDVNSSSNSSSRPNRLPPAPPGSLGYKY